MTLRIYIVTQEREVVVVAEDPIYAAKLGDAAFKGVAPDVGIRGNVRIAPRNLDLRVTEG